MAEKTSRLQQLREASPSEALRLVYRKAIYRKVVMGEYAVRAGDTTPPATTHELDIEILDMDHWDRALRNNPYLGAVDLDRFRTQRRATCIAAFDDDAIVASTWMLQGEAPVDELDRSIIMEPRWHYSCRSFVSVDYRGMALLGHMIGKYSLAIDPDDVVWGLVYDWNVASSRSLEGLGWRYQGDWWTTFILGMKFHGEPPSGSRPLVTRDQDQQ